MISIIGSPAQFSQQLLGGFLGNQETMVATPLQPLISLDFLQKRVGVFSRGYGSTTVSVARDSANNLYCV